MSKYWTSIFLSFFVACGFAGQAPAEETGTLEALWQDQAGSYPTSGKQEKGSNKQAVQEEASSKEKLSSKAPANEAAPPLEAQAKLPKAGSGEFLAPMCSLAEFVESQFVTGSIWPGVGPFKVSQKDKYVDNNENQLSIEQVDNRITKVELTLEKLSLSKEAPKFFDMEMVADFLLESLAAKPAKIAEFNGELEKNKDVLLKGQTKEFTVGRYLVALSTQGSCSISVNSLDASKAIIKEHSVSAAENKLDNGAAASASSPVPVEPEKTKEKKTTAVSDHKDEFLQVIKLWQTIKKQAVRKRDTSQLAGALSGRALARQTDAVKWLVSNHKYYDMNPKNVFVEKYQELVPGKKYLVLSQVQESSKFIDEPTGQILKEVDDKYTVNYTIEKIGERWMITDSALLSTTSEKNASTKVSKVSR